MKNNFLAFFLFFVTWCNSGFAEQNKFEVLDIQLSDNGNLINAGAVYTDLPAVVDKNIVTTAHYKDMGPWMKAVIKNLK